MEKIKISAIITSGGNSTRFGKNKLLEKISLEEFEHFKTPISVIEATILKFVDLVDEIIVPCKDDVRETILNSSVLNNTVNSKSSDCSSVAFINKIKFAPAGTSRQKSVYQGILACSNPEIVLIHDGARPFIDKESIKKVIEMTFENKAVVLGKMAVDTIKEVELNYYGSETIENNEKTQETTTDKTIAKNKARRIIKTLNRKKIFHAQTPQGFDYKLIKQIHEKYKDDDSFTDDSSMIEAFGIDVYIVENDKKNIKITVCDDLI